MPGAPWLLTAAMSPRPSVRVAAVDAHGQALNEYTGTAPVDGDQPDRPWALYLAGPDRRFRLLAFDLDAKTPGTDPAREADVLAVHLTAAGIEHVICQSGPGGGRHVWVALAEAADAQLVYDVAVSVQRACPTLDRTPLTNPATGCVRPPGAPHRAGGTSVVLRGDTATLTAPRTTVGQLLAFASALNAEHPQAPAAAPRSEDGPLPVDETGNVYLPGPRRPLPAASAAALDEDAAAAEDASAVLWRVLTGAAAARWHYKDVAGHLSTAPGLEYARTERIRKGSPQRRPRPARGSHAPEAVLRVQWHRAVRHVATTPRQIGDDPTFEPRAAAIAAHADRVQTRADASPGRWTRGGGPADRRVLDVLCLLALQAVSATVEADTRRLALLAGIGRETARTALLRLSEDGWIAQARPADGPHGAHWTIDPQNAIHRDADHARSQAVTRPAGAGPAWRGMLLDELTTRTAASSHDAFTPAHGLGLHAGNTYARLTQPATTAELARATAQHPDAARATLHRLARHGLVLRTPTGWAPAPADTRDAAADRLGVAGTLDARAARYTIERVLWGWWSTEQTWMSAQGSKPRRRRPTLAQPALTLGRPWDMFPKYPRAMNHRADHRAAQAALVGGQLDHLDLARLNQVSIQAA
ncbi:hypothetical protein [Arthrobacter liuii]|uniref:hypothetical protein n=1 Tax=Arthrobacter liuii TaxID=1476996 RepID=UPI00366D3C67